MDVNRPCSGVTPNKRTAHGIRHRVSELDIWLIAGSQDVLRNSIWGQEGCNSDDLSSALPQAFGSESKCAGHSVVIHGCTAPSTQFLSFTSVEIEILARGQPCLFDVCSGLFRSEEHT